MLLYRLVSIALYPFIELYLFYRVYKKKEDKKRLRERFGMPLHDRPAGRIIWVHAVSVGETNSVLILVDELLEKNPQASILFTTTTLTSAATVAAKLPEFQGRVIHQFLPVDSYVCVKKFLNFWQPEMVFFVESEIWPNLICEARLMGSKVFLVNARMSKKSAGRWYLAKQLGFNIFDCFNAIFAQSEEDQKRLAELTQNEVLCFGNLKSQARDLSSNPAELEKLKEQIGDRKFWLAASTHKGEEELVIAAHGELKKYFPDLLTIIVPRHPNRAEEIKTLLGSFNFSQRSRGEEISNTTEIYLADTLGELGTFYRLSSFAFLGGSLLPIGGHNPYEPIKLGCAVISGSQVFNFKEIYENLESQNGCVIIESPSEIAQNVKKFLEDQNLVKTLADKGMQVIKNSNNIAERIVDTVI